MEPPSARSYPSYEELESISADLLESIKPQVANLASSADFNQACLQVEGDAASRVYRATSFGEEEYNEKLLMDSFEIHKAKLKNNENGGDGDNSANLLSKSAEDR